MNRSIQYVGALDLPENTNRHYFYIVVTLGDITVEFGGGGGKIPLGVGKEYAPVVCPTSSIKIEGTGTYILHTAE